MTVTIKGNDYNTIEVFENEELGTRVDVFEEQGTYRVRLVDTDADEVWDEIMIYDNITDAVKKAKSWAGI